MTRAAYNLARRAQTLSFWRGWRDAGRFRSGLSPAQFGAGPKRDHHYADGWKSSMMLARGLQPRRELPST